MIDEFFSFVDQFRKAVVADVYFLRRISSNVTDKENKVCFKSPSIVWNEGFATDVTGMVFLVHLDILSLSFLVLFVCFEN
jgi:hypothetical protein